MKKIDATQILSSNKWIVPVIFIIVLIIILPLLKGIGKVAGFAGDVLGLPFDIVKKLNKGIDDNIHNNFITLALRFADANIYDPKNKSDIEKAEKLSKEFFLRPGDYQKIMAAWKKTTPSKIIAITNATAAKSYEAAKLAFLKKYHVPGYS